VEICLSVKATLAELTVLVNDGLAAYTSIHGDKTAVIEQKTGKAKLEKHYTLERRSHPAGSFILKIWGRTGHMAALSEHDNAITKAAYILIGLHTAWKDLRVSFPENRLSDTLVAEGGQGFVPTHDLEAIKERLRSAMLRAWESYRKQHRSSDGEPNITFEKLHNEAYDGDPNSDSIRAARWCSELVGLDAPEPIVGWTASCDARLFARIHPGKEVITTGPGKLSLAHSDDESIEVAEVGRSAAMLTLFLLAYTGAVSGSPAIAGGV
jgi:acetylornithine deacetylase/succinyl-diaminopimelate desuccinylase-like protein